MDKKTDKRPRSRGLSNLQSAGEDLQKTVNEKNIEFSTENNIPFSFTLDRNLVLFIKELVLKKINESVENYHFNESTAVREGIQLLSKNSPVKQRPAIIGNPTKRGRKRGSSGSSITNKDVVKVSTSFLISESDREYIYNYIYENSKGDERFTKEQFFVLVVEQLEQKYKMKFQG